jgi:hypothetical protein
MSATDRSFIQRSPTECGVCVSVVSKAQQWGGLGPLGLSSHGMCIISSTFHSHVVRSWHIGLLLPLQWSQYSVKCSTQFTFWIGCYLKSVRYYLFSNWQEIWHFDGCDYEIWCLLGYDAVLSDGNVVTFRRNLLSSLLVYVTLLETSWRFRKLLRFVIVVVEAVDSPLKLRQTPTKVDGVTSQSTAVFTVRLVTFCLTCPVSFQLLPFPIRRSSFCVCSMLLPAMDQWRKLLSFSCFIPPPRQKKTYPHHTCSYSRSLPGFIRKFQSWWNVSLPASIARTPSLALPSYVQRGKLIRNGALGWGPYCLVIFMYVLSEHILPV